MNVTITPAKLTGAVTPPPSKSQAHRVLIAAALADGESVISNVAYSQDIEATMDCLENLGAEFTSRLPIFFVINMIIQCYLRWRGEGESDASTV